MTRPRPPLLAAVAFASALWAGCGSTPRDQHFGMEDDSGYTPPITDAGPPTDAPIEAAAASDASDASDDASDASDDTSDAGGAAGSDGAISDAGADG